MVRRKLLAICSSVFIILTISCKKDRKIVDCDHNSILSYVTFVGERKMVDSLFCMKCKQLIEVKITDGNKER